jgi:hypothetical protein
VLRALLLFAILLGGAFALHEKAMAGADHTNPSTATPTPGLIGGLDPDGLQLAPPHDVIGRLDPNGGK